MRTVTIVLVGAVALYLSAIAYVMAFQRSFVFDVRDSGGTLDAAGTIAIPGSQRIAIPTSDGETLAGWYLPPRQPDAPVFLFMHGKSGGLERKVGRWSRLADRGAGVLAFSYRGYPGSTGEPSEAGLYEDARAAYRWLAGRHESGRIVLHGLSLGTGVASRLATEVDAKAVVLEAPFAALVDVAAARQPWLPVHLLLIDRFESLPLMAKLRMPLLIVHGTRDTAIPISHAERLYAAAKEPKRLVAIPGGDHSTLPRDGLYDHVFAFLGDLDRSRTLSEATPPVEAPAQP
ncbi:MAG: alpha/beta hydrolase [Hyphomicrobiaceae bacterium]|nr:alpha/beta hydrolase [Hyphomicrobiaceae bacterium]